MRILLILLLLPVHLFAQVASSDEGIKFEHSSWKEIVAKAKQENKLIFLDCYTSWCGPCKIMAKTVFKEAKVGEFFNKNFVNSKFDMGVGEGKILKDKFNVSVFPTFLVINSDEEVIHRFVGGMKSPQFIAKAQEALDGKGVAYYNNEYASGNRDAAFVQNYIKILEEAYLQQQAGVVVDEYFKTVDKSTIFTKANWDLFNNNLSDVDSDMFKYVDANKEKFYPVVQKDLVVRKLMGCWRQSANAKFLVKGDNGYKFDESGLKAFAKRMKKAGVKDVDGIVFDATHAAAYRLGDWERYVKMAEKSADKASGLVLYNWGLKVSKGCKDKELRLRTAKVLENAIERFTKAAAKEAKKKKADSGNGIVAMSMSGPSMDITYNKYLKDLVEKLRK